MRWVLNRGSSPHTVVEGANYEMCSDRHRGKINSLRGELRERGEKPACRQTKHVTPMCSKVVSAKAVHPRDRPLFTRVLVIFLKSDTVPSTTTGRLFLQLTRIACDTLKLCAHLCPQPLDKNPIQTSYVNEGGWGRRIAAQGGL